VSVADVTYLSGCLTSLTISSVPVPLVGVVLAVLENAGLTVEIHVTASTPPVTAAPEPAAATDGAARAGSPSAWPAGTSRPEVP
jgi:hypothetical protein